MTLNDPIFPRLIVGLGNPGTKYEKTRHNLGFEVVKAYAKKQDWSFKNDLRLKGKLAKGRYEEIETILLLPMTYMNLSGISIEKALKYFKIPLDKLLVVVDEVYLTLGTLRLRPYGSSGGHNGLKSIEGHLHTQNYSRLRLGVGSRSGSHIANHYRLESYVLDNFAEDEQDPVIDVIDKGVKVIESWICEGFEKSAKLAQELSQPKNNTIP